MPKNKKLTKQSAHRNKAAGTGWYASSHVEKKKKEVDLTEKQVRAAAVKDERSRAERKQRVGKPQSVFLGNRTRTEKGREGYGHTPNRLLSMYDWGDPSAGSTKIREFQGEPRKNHLVVLVRIFIHDIYDFYNDQWCFYILMYFIRTYNLSHEEILPAFRTRVLGLRANRTVMEDAISRFGFAVLPHGFVVVDDTKVFLHHITIKDGHLLRFQHKFYETNNELVKNAHNDMMKFGSQRPAPVVKQLNGANGEHTGKDDVKLSEMCLQDQLACRCYYVCEWFKNSDEYKALIFSFALVCHVNPGVHANDILESFISLLDIYPMPHHDCSVPLIQYDEWSNKNTYLDILDFVLNSTLSAYLGVSLPMLALVFERHDELIASQLNGSNGEWTNTDDMPVDDGLKQMSNAKKHVTINDCRISKAHEFQKKVSGGRNDGDNATRRVKEKEKVNKTTPPKKEEPTPKEQRPFKRIICLEDEKFGWDGKDIYNKLYGGCCVNKRTGKVHETGRSNNLYNKVKQAGLGYLDQFTDEQSTDDSSERSVLQTPWIHETVTNRFIHESMQFDECQYHVFIPAMEILKKKFSSTQITESLVNGMVACLNREFNLVDDSLLLETINCYVHLSHRKNYLLSKTNISKTKVKVVDRMDEKYLSVLNLERTNDDILKFQSVDCKVADVYKGRTDCLITRIFNKEKTHWTGNNDEQYNEDDPDSYPKFLNYDDEAKSDGYYRSQFLSFDSPNTKPFVTYSVNATNACKALKRMAGARESQDYDHYLSTLQYASFMEVVNREYDGEQFYIDNQQFFINGRIDVKCKKGQLDKLLVGPKIWSLKTTPDIPAEIRRSSYLSPYEFRPASRYDKPVFRDPGLVQRSLQVLEDADIVVEKVLYENDFQSGDYFGWIGKTVFFDSTVDPKKTTELPCTLRNWMSHKVITVDDQDVETIVDRFGDLPIFRGNSYELNMVHDRMAFGFKELEGCHNIDKINTYVESHPNWIYMEGWLNYLTHLDCESDRTWHAAITHVKKKLRKIFVAEQLVHTPTDVMVKAVNAKVKKEFAKFGKVPRLFVTYDAGCMYANELPEYSKICLDGTYVGVCNGVTTEVCIFAKPGSERLRTELNKSVNAMGRRNYLNILIYSDDSVWTGNVNGIDFAFNVDISSCDSGNKAGVFGLVYILLSKFRADLALGLVTQCAQPISLTNPECKDERMEIQMATYFEGSGTVLTTILNHVAMYMVGQVATVLFGQRQSLLRSWTDVKTLIMECGVLFGHVLSVEECIDGSSFCPEKIQFLKRSPILTEDGHYVPCMNYGTIFRSFGSVEGDLVAEMVGLEAKEFSAMGWDDRWELFGSRVVAGLVNEPNSVILQALRERYPLVPKRFNAWSEVKIGHDRIQMGGFEMAGFGEGGKVTLDEMSLTRRYGCSVYEMEMLASQIRASKFGDVFPSTAIGSFFKTDYGLGEYN